MQIDNDDLCAFGIITSLRARKGPYEKVVVNRGIPMLVQKNWIERLFTLKQKAKDNAHGGNRRRE